MRGEAPPRNLPSVGIGAVADLLALGFGLLCGLVLARPGPLPTDDWLLSGLRSMRRPLLDTVARDVLHADDLVLLTLAAAGAGLLLAILEHTLRPLAIATIGIGCSAAAAALVKGVAARSRPPLFDLLPSVGAGGSAFPSMHATQTASVLVLLGLLVGPHVPAGRIRNVSATAAFTVVGAVGLSWLYLGTHWPSDVLAGWLLGGSCALAVCELAGHLPSSQTAGPAQSLHQADA